jgi:hypothetical protein
MGKKIRVWDGTAWQDVAPSLPYTAIHSAQASMPATGVDGQVWLDTDGTLSGQDFVPLSGGTMTGNLNTPSINSGPIVGRNKIINGDMGIWQRGTSPTTTYTADRWTKDGGSVTRSTDAPAGFAYSLQIANAPGNPAIRQGIELPGVGLAGPFAVGTTWTISCYARVSTTVTSQLTLFACFNNGVNSGVSVQLVNNSVGIPTTTWQRFSTTFTINSAPAGTDNCLMFVPYLANGAYAGNFNITGLQIEQGSVATPYHNATPNQQTELAACQRYYWRLGGENVYENFGVGMSGTSSFSIIYVQNPVPMRIAPTSIEYANLQLTDNYAYDTPVSNVVFGGGSKNRMASRLDITHGAAATAFRPAFLRTANTLNGYLALSAEL